MKIIVKTWLNEEDDYKTFYKLELKTDEGILVFTVHDGEPEDSNLSRDFNDVYDLPLLLNYAFKAGKNNEVMELVEKECKTEEEWSE